MTLPTYHSTVILLEDGHPLGTGFLVHDSGLLVTCFHILRDRFHSEANAIGQVLHFVTLPDSESTNPTVRQAEVMANLDPANDAALLQIQGDLPADLQPVKLIRSEHPSVSGAAFSLLGYGEVPDPGVLYRYYSATGIVESLIPREQVKVLKITSKDLHLGMSGGAIYTTHLGGVVGMQSRRLNLDLDQDNWGRDTGFVCMSEAIAALAPDVLKLSDPMLSEAASSPGIQTINAQTLQFAGGINAQTVMFADLGLTESWHPPMEVSWPSQQDIPRSMELKAIRGRLVAGDRAPASTGLALWGIGGSGKSTLAEQYARQYGETYKGGVVHVKLGAQFDPQQDLQPILSKWAEYGYGGTRQLADLLGKQRVDITPQDIARLFSGRGKMLAVLDSVHSGEHLSQVLEALPTGTDLLITTPSQQSLEGVAISPQFLEVQGLQPEDAIAFLQNRLPQLPADLLRQLAATFDYHAQALLLITAELRNNANPEAVAQQLLYQQNHEALASIRTAFEYSYQQLASEGDRQRFRQFGSLCPPPADFSEELATALWDSDTDTALQFLQTLQQRTLVAQGTGRRWSMNSLIYNFASELLQAEAESELIGLTLSRYHLYMYKLAVAGEAWDVRHPELLHLKYVGNQLIDGFAATYSINFDTLEAEPDETLSDDQRTYWETIANYIISARSYLFQPEAKGLAERWLGTLVTIGQVLDEPASAALGFFLLGQWCLLCDNDVQSEGAKRAVQMFDRAHPLWRRVRDIQSVGYALIAKGNALMLQGDTKQTLATLEMALQEIETVGDDDWQLRATLLVSLSRQYLSINEHDQARQYLEQATELCEGQPFTDLTAKIAQQFSVLSLNRGKPQESMERLRQVREQAVRIGRDRIVAEIDIGIGLSQLYLGDGDAATQTFETVMSQAEALVYPQLRPPALTGLAAVHFTNGEFQHARDLLEEALHLLNRYQDKSQEAQVLASLGEVAFAMNEADAALNHLRQALPLLHTVQDTTTAVKTLNTIGLIYQQTNRISEGLIFLKRNSLGYRR